ncbi:hypothetical protein [Sphingomonas asaccharolytica]|uniref:hypothetical protein n=1 Tax=Sphingomonas asaccharolytica TaxID=40681 RepID=UPI000ABBD12D|nr:hypothetical protein [Sphingomonas asaccharolytica]
MHHPHSLHYQFDPNSPGWLHRKHEKNKRRRKGEKEDPIRASEVLRVIESDPAAFLDPIVQHYATLALKRKLKSSRGRKRGGVSRAIKLAIADVMIEDRAAEIRAERKRSGQKHVRGDLEPCRQAAEEVSRFLSFNMTGPALLNAISKDAFVI